MNKYCFWKNGCEEHTYTCCHFCNNKACDMRCKDDPSTCKYNTDINVGEVKRNKQLVFAPKKEEPKGPKLLKISEVAKQLNVKYDDIYLLVTTNIIKTTRVNNRYFIEETELNTVKEKLRNKIKK